MLINKQPLGSHFSLVVTLFVPLIPIEDRFHSHYDFSMNDKGDLVRSFFAKCVEGAEKEGITVEELCNEASSFFKEVRELSKFVTSSIKVRLVRRRLLRRSPLCLER